ncbi:MAG TPA: peptidase M4 [Desulfobulbus sp.]|nr:peptidase M4 [Desulfobulbus sp.]
MSKYYSMLEVNKMKKKTATIFKSTTALITTIAVASLLQVGISSAANKDQQLKSGTIRVQQDESAYPGLAQITLEQAKDAALSNVQGEVLKIQLEDEDGFLVYGVEIVAPDKSISDVKVDAGNGKVLRVDKDSADNERDGYDEEDKNDRHEGDREDNDHEGRD